MRKQYYSGDFIAENEMVDDHLNTIEYFANVSCTYVYSDHLPSISIYCLFYGKDVPRDDLCGTTRWKAAKAVSRSLVNLDESGLEVAGCRHAIGQKAVNMFRGEMYVHYR